MASSLKNTKVRLDFFTDIDTILVVEKGIRAEICHTIHLYSKASDYDKNKESSHVKYWNLKNLYGWKISQNLLVINFKQVKSFLNLMKDL